MEMKEEIILDLFRLHLEEDKDPRSWILASGKNLRKEVNILIKDLLKQYKKYQIINELLPEINIELLKNKDPVKFGKEIKSKRLGLKLGKKKTAKITRTSCEDWNKIEKSKHFPSCTKLRRIQKYLGKSSFLRIKCKNNKLCLCLKKLILIWDSLFNTKEEIPIIVINNLFNLWKKSIKTNSVKKKIKLLDSIEYLRSNHHCSEKIKATSGLNEDLAKIIGAFCADGSLTAPDQIRWEEEHLSNMNALAKWTKNCFRSITINPAGRERNSYVTSFRSKIITRYLLVFFKFKPGTKKYTGRAPKIIREAPLNIQKAFALGAIIFDGSVDSKGRISFGVVSKKFRDDIAKIMKKENVDFTLSTLIKREDGFKHKPLYTVSLNPTIDKNKEKSLNYFERDTIKWKKLKDHIYGFDNKVKNLKEARDTLKIYYYKKLNEPKMHKLLDLIKRIKKFDVYDIIQITKTPRGTMCNQLNMFCKFNILSKEYKSRRMKYSYNNNISEWKLPDISLHPNQYSL